MEPTEEQALNDIWMSLSVEEKRELLDHACAYMCSEMGVIPDLYQKVQDKLDAIP
jgi:hypothetical protein